MAEEAMSDDELSAGVLAYLQKGVAASPRADGSACAAVAATREPTALVREVEALVQESLTVPVHWDGMSLGDVGRHVAAEMATRHPELSQEAQEALAWNFTFAWR
jgi:pimeloyl-ACP methyl ester carboxylesterase